MKHYNVRSTLISRTIEVIATAGLDKTTTKAIAEGTGFGEMYIYRHFKNKDDLLAKTFDSLDEELVVQVLRYVPNVFAENGECEQNFRDAFFPIWDFLIGNREKCLAFIRYYYSPYYAKYSVESHKERYAPLVELIRPAFKEEADVWMILVHILNVMLAFAVKVFYEEMPKDDDYVEHVFRVIYHSIEQYFKTE